MIHWRGCPKCGKSFDGVYLGYFGCRSCGTAERVEGVVFTDLVGPVPAIAKPKVGRPKYSYRREDGHVLRAR